MSPNGISKFLVRFVSLRAPGGQYVAIDRTSKIAFVQLHEKATQRIAAAFLHDLVAAVPYTIHTVLTDNGIQFTDNRPLDEEAEAKAAAYWAERDEPRIYRWHSFEWACE